MKQHYLLILTLLLLAGACKKTNDDGVFKADAAALSRMDSLFFNITVSPQEKVDCSSLMPAMPPDAAFEVQASTLRKAVSPALLQKTGIIRNMAKDSADKVMSFDSLSRYYAIGKFSYSDSLMAYLLAAYKSADEYSVHLLLYSDAQKSFIAAQSLNFVVSGGQITTTRSAWLYDVNQDGALDIAYLLNGVYRDPEMGEFRFIEDELHVERWDGRAFQSYDGPEMEEVRQLVLAGSASTGESAAGFTDEFN